MVKVSIIVPVYNVYPYLEKCLNSLINQTLKDIEIIVVNDGTKDDSQSIIDKYAKKDKRVKAFIKENGGLGDARNYGIKHATGEYLGFVDSDDYVDATMFEKMYNKAKENNSDMLECDLYWCYDNKTVLDKATYYEKNTDIMANIRVLVCNKLFKREVIIKNDIAFPVGLRYEDISFTYKTLPFINNIAYLDEALYFYIQRGDSLSNNQTEKVRDIFNILSEVESYYKSKKIYKKYKDVLEYINIRYLLGSSFLRILGIKDNALRKSILDENWLVLNKNYPDWKHNKYLKEIKTMKNKYYRYTNKLTYNICSKLFRLKR